MSRIVVREALGRLQARGLIEIRPGVGAFVVPMPDRSVTEPLGLYIRRHGVAPNHLFEARRALEPAMAAAAARRRPAPALAALEATLRRTRAAAAAFTADGNDPDEALEAFAWADLTFHQQLAVASGNPLFELLLAPLLEPLLEVRRDGARLPGAADAATAQHEVVLDAVRAGDPDGAAAAMVAHLDAVAGWLRTVRTPARPAPEDRP